MFERTDFVLNNNNTLNLQFNYNRLNASGLDDGSTRSLASADNNINLTGDSYWVRGTLNTLFGSTIVNQVAGAVGARRSQPHAQLDHCRNT